jgi:hypothetical protein
MGTHVSWCGVCVRAHAPCCAASPATGGALANQSGLGSAAERGGVSGAGHPARAVIDRRAPRRHA